MNMLCNNTGCMVSLHYLSCFLVCYRVLPLHDSAEIFTIRTAAWHNEVEAVRSWYQTEHDNWSVVAGGRSRWWVWNAAVEITKKSVVQVQTYLQRISAGVFIVSVNIKQINVIMKFCLVGHSVMQQRVVFYWNALKVHDLTDNLACDYKDMC